MAGSEWLALGAVAVLSLAAGFALRWALRRPGWRKAPAPADPADLVVLAGVAFLAGSAWGVLARRVDTGEGVGPHLLGNVGIALIAAGAILVSERRLARRDALGVGSGRLGPGLGLGILTALALLAPNLAIHWATIHYLLRPEDTQEILQPTQLLLLELDPLGLAIMALLLAVAVPLFEETIFRGLLQGGLERLLRLRLGPASSRTAAVVAASLVFTAVHPPQTWIPIFILSLALGALYAVSGNLYAPIVAHGGHNLMSVALLRYPELLPG